MNAGRNNYSRGRGSSSSQASFRSDPEYVAERRRIIRENHPDRGGSDEKLIKALRDLDTRWERKTNFGDSAAYFDIPLPNFIPDAVADEARQRAAEYARRYEHDIERAAERAADILNRVAGVGSSVNSFRSKAAGVTSRAADTVTRRAARLAARGQSFASRLQEEYRKGRDGS